jgi:hypothetical protein
VSIRPLAWRIRVRRSLKSDLGLCRSMRMGFDPPRPGASKPGRHLERCEAGDGLVMPRTLRWQDEFTGDRAPWER